MKTLEGLKAELVALGDGIEHPYEKDLVLLTDRTQSMTYYDWNKKVTRLIAIIADRKETHVEVMVELLKDCEKIIDNIVREVKVPKTYERSEMRIRLHRINTVLLAKLGTDRPETGIDIFIEHEHKKRRAEMERE